MKEERNMRKRSRRGEGRKETFYSLEDVAHITHLQEAPCYTASVSGYLSSDYEIILALH